MKLPIEYLKSEKEAMRKEWPQLIMPVGVAIVIAYLLIFRSGDWTAKASAISDYCGPAEECYMIGEGGLEFGLLLMEAQDEMGEVYKRAKAIAQCEGFNHKRLTVARRNNNPGNLKAGLPHDSQGHTIYTTEIGGWNALHGLLWKHRKQTVWQMSRWYASAKDDWFKCVTSQLKK